MLPTTAFRVCAGAAGGCLRPGLCPLPTVRRGAGKQARMLLRILVDAHACVSACLCVCLAAGVSAYFSACLPVSTFRANDVCAACRDVVRGCDGRGWRDHLLPRLLVPPDALPRQHHHRPHWAHGKQQAATHLIIALSLSKQIALPFSSCRAQRLRTGCAVCMVVQVGTEGRRKDLKRMPHEVLLSACPSVCYQEAQIAYSSQYTQSL